MQKFVSIAIVFLLAPAVFAQEFKIETLIYSGKEKQAVSRNLTLFQDTLVFDLKLDQATPPNVLETRIYDSRMRAVSLIDTKKKTQVKLTDHRLLQLVDSLRKDISENEKLSFLIQEKFTETKQASTDSVELISPTIRYRATGKRPADNSRLSIYNEFLDTFTRLNASHPAGFPPFARLKLNQSIKRMGWLPTKVEVEVQPNALIPNGLKMSSTHTVIDGLSAQDKERIKTARSNWLAFKQVDLLTYRGIQKTAAVEETPVKK